MLSPPGHSFSSRHTFHCHDSFKPYVRRPCLCISAQSLPRSGSLCRVSASGPQCEPTARLPLLLAGSILCNTLAAPLLLPAPAENALPLPEATAVAVPSSKPAQYYVADAPIVQADPEVIEQQQWWQQDQQVSGLVCCQDHTLQVHVVLGTPLCWAESCQNLQLCAMLLLWYQQLDAPLTFM